MKIFSFLSDKSKTRQQPQSKQPQNTGTAVHNPKHENRKDEFPKESAKSTRSFFSTTLDKAIIALPNKSRVKIKNGFLFIVERIRFAAYPIIPKKSFSGNT